MKDSVYKVFVDIWRLTYKYRFQKLDDEQWECFLSDAKKLMSRYRNTEAETIFRYLFMAIQTFYEKISKSP